MTLYEILGVKPTASTAEIRKAYRKLAQQLHPDKGGDQGKFQDLQNAYAVLTDVERRARYDQTGQDAPDSTPTAEQQIMAQAQHHLAQLIVAFVEKHSESLRNKPLKDLMHTEVCGKVKGVEEDLKKLAKQRKALLEVADRFTPISGESVMGPLALSILSGVDGQIAQASNFKAICLKMVEILEAHEYRADLMIGDGPGAARRSIFGDMPLEEIFRQMNGAKFGGFNPGG